MILVSEYMSEDEDRKARVFTTAQGPVVEFYYNGTLVERRPLEAYTLRYAEDAAENYVEGILKV